MATEPRRPSSTPLRVLALTSDPAFVQAAREALAPAAGFALTAAPNLHAAEAAHASADVVLVDLDGASPEIVMGAAFAERGIPAVAVTSTFDADLARRLLHLRIADFVLKPVNPGDLVRVCRQAGQTPQSAPDAPTTDAKIYSFLPASGGVGVTTLAIETALILAGSSRRGASSTCLVDLDFQHGACADYLDIEPRLDLNEIEPRPERLDTQLLEVMLSRHASGLAVIGAPNRPAEMRSFDPTIVTRLLDLVSMQFDYVVLDLPRTWFAWTDNILLGSDHSFIVTEATVPGLRHANALIAAITQRLGESASPRVIVNRFEQRMFASGIKRADIEQSLGAAFAGTVPNNYRLVREAIDRGVPLEEVKVRSDVSTELRKIVVPAAAKNRRFSLAGASARIGLFQGA